MKRKTLLATGLVVALAAAASVPVLAHGTGGQGMGQGMGQGYGQGMGQGYGPGAMMDNDGDDGPRGGGPGQMGRGYGQGMPGGGYGMMGGQGGPGMMGGYGGMGGGMMSTLMTQFDANGDGTVSPEELRAGLQGELKKYDANSDGTLSLDEFATLYAALTRPATVRHFQALDVNGDGKVTADEISAPADRFEWMQKVWQSHQGGAMPQGEAGSMKKDGGN